MARTETHRHGAVRHPHETELAVALAPASKKPRLFLEAPAVGPITVRSLRGAAGSCSPRSDVQGFVTATHSRALRPDLVRAEAAGLGARAGFAASIPDMERTR
jgi:hypothetical protein